MIVGTVRVPLLVSPDISDTGNPRRETGCGMTPVRHQHEHGDSKSMWVYRAHHNNKHMLAPFAQVGQPMFGSRMSQCMLFAGAWCVQPDA